MTSPQEIAVGADEGWIIPNVGVILYDISVFITTLKQCLIENVPLSFLRIRVVSEAQKLRESLQTGLTITEALWPPLRQAYEWLHQAAHLLANEDQQSVATLKASYERLLSTMTAEQEKLGELAHAVTHFCKVAASYWEGLFALYWLLGSSVQKQTLRDRERSPSPACKHRRVGVQSGVVHSMLMLEHRYFHGREKLLLWLV